jgi:hypothetical protein
VFGDNEKVKSKKEKGKSAGQKLKNEMNRKKIFAPPFFNFSFLLFP